MGNWKRIPQKPGPRVPASLIRILAFASALSFLGACASSPGRSGGDPTLPEIDVLQLKENSDEALKLAQENKLQLQSMETKVRELETRISSLGDEVANLPAAKVEELTQQMALMTEQLRSLEDRLAKGGGASPAKKDMPVFAPGSPEAGQSAQESPDSSEAGKIAAIRAGAAAKKAPRKPPASDVEAQLYKKAFDLYYGRDYGQAVSRFEELLKKFPASGYADNCNYWIGECHFAQGNFAKAVAAFRKVFTFSETEKADDAQLKLGYCALRLGDRKQAAEEFKKVVSLYPDSEYTERAKEELAKLE